MSANVLTARQGNVVTITLNRPDVFNAMNYELCGELSSAIDQCHEDESVRAVILTGAGRAFSGGGDMRLAQETIARDGNSLHFFRELTKLLHRAIADLRLLPKPVIAAVNGTAAGAGFSTVMSCDLRIAAAGAKFKQAYTSMGLSPDGGWTATVPALVGMAKANELMMLDPVIDAQQALTLGLINRVVPDEDLAREAMDLAQRLAEGPTKSYAAAKALLNAALMPHLESQLELERQTISACSHTEDFQRAVEAFLAKRKPDFVGK